MKHNRILAAFTIPLLCGLVLSSRHHVRVHPFNHLSDVPLVLSSFTKSYILDRAARAALATDGVSGVVVNIGGDLVVRGDWTEAVAVANPANGAENSEPLSRLAVRDRAVATSGYRRGVEIDGRHYSHIIDPPTGRPAGHIVSPPSSPPMRRPRSRCSGRPLAATMSEVEYLLVAIWVP